MRTRTRDERGATAVLFALLALVLLGVSALAIDVGHVYAKRSALQSNVDFAVMAAAAELDSDGACNQKVIDAAADFLEKDTNKVPDQTALNLGGSSSDGDGFIRCNDWKVELWPRLPRSTSAWPGPSWTMPPRMPASTSLLSLPLRSCPPRARRAPSLCTRSRAATPAARC